MTFTWTRSLHKAYKSPLPGLCRLPSERFWSLALSLQEGDPSVSCRSQAQGKFFHLKEERRNKGQIPLMGLSFCTRRAWPPADLDAHPWFSVSSPQGSYSAPWFNMQIHQHLIITWTMTPAHLVLVKNHNWLCQLQTGTCHPPLQEWNQVLLQLLTFNTLWKEFRVESRNEALGATGKLTGQVFRRLDIFRSWPYEPNSSISSYLEKH